MAGKNGKNEATEEKQEFTLTSAQIDKLAKDTEENPIGKAFSTESGFNAAKAMVELKDDLELNALLLDIPDKRFVVAAKYAYYQYLKHNAVDRKKALEELNKITGAKTGSLNNGVIILTPPK